MEDKVIIYTDGLIINSINRRHLIFLLNLWNDPVIMRYAGFERNWNYEDINNWYERYLKRKARFGNTEIHFVVKLKDGTLIGESGLGRLRKNWSCKNYKSPINKLSLMTDIKLIRKFWNKGYATEAMKAIANYVLTKTTADILIVPPHRDNIPAIRVYEKAGFKKTDGIYYGYHIIYEITKDDFNSKIKKKYDNIN